MSGLNFRIVLVDMADRRNRAHGDERVTKNGKRMFPIGVEDAVGAVIGENKYRVLALLSGNSRSLGPDARQATSANRVDSEGRSERCNIGTKTITVRYPETACWIEIRKRLCGTGTRVRQVKYFLIRIADSLDNDFVRVSWENGT